MVTAEAAAVVPLLSLVALLLAWAVSLGIDQVQVVDAARDAARAIARGDDEGAAARAARRTAGDGAEVDIDRSGDLVSVTVSAEARSPGWLPFPEVTLRGHAHVAVEDASGSS